MKNDIKNIFLHKFFMIKYWKKWKLRNKKEEEKKKENKEEELQILVEIPNKYMQIFSYLNSSLRNKKINLYL